MNITMRDMDTIIVDDGSRRIHHGLVAHADCGLRAVYLTLIGASLPTHTPAIHRQQARVLADAMLTYHR